MPESVKQPRLQETFVRSQFKKYTVAEATKKMSFFLLRYINYFLKICVFGFLLQFLQFQVYNLNDLNYFSK